MTWPPPPFIAHPRLGWSIDCSGLGYPMEAFASLSWHKAFEDMSALEAGELVNLDEEKQVGHYWLRAPDRAPTIGQATLIGETTEAYRHFAKRIRDGLVVADDGHPFTDVLHIGIGGSVLGAQLLVDAIRPEQSSGLTVHFIDNIDPDGIEDTLAIIGERLAHTLVIVATKSGGTKETLGALALTIEAQSKQKLDSASRLIALTHPNSSLAKRATSEKWLKQFPIWDWVGGRFSITSVVGLLTGELAGIHTTELLDGARAMDEWTRTLDWEKNPAALIAGGWFLVGHGKGTHSMVILPYADRLERFSRYLQQLVMESVGKTYDRKGQEVYQGLTVYGNKGSSDQHALVQQLRDGPNNFFALFVDVLTDGLGSPLPVADQHNGGDLLQGFLLGTRQAFTASKRRHLTLMIPDLSARTLGGLVALMERTVELYGSLIDVNAYHQPGVEAGKACATNIMALSTSIQQVLWEGPADVILLADRLNANVSDVYSILERLYRTGRIQRILNTDVPTYAIPSSLSDG